MEGRSVTPIPPVVWERIRRFLDAGTTGQVVLDVKDGRVMAYKLTECGRVDERAGTRTQDPVIN